MPDAGHRELPDIDQRPNASAPIAAQPVTLPPAGLAPASARPPIAVERSALTPGAEARAPAAPDAEPAPTEPVPAQPSRPEPAATGKPAVARSAPVPEVRPRRRWRRRVLLILGPVVALLVAFYVYATGGRFVSTDNAYVQAHIVNISADVSGRVVALWAEENQTVQAGQPLFRIDPESFQIALDRADAQLREVHDRLAALQASYRQRQVQLRSAEETVAFQHTEFARQQALHARGNAAQAALDQAQHNLALAQDQAAAIEQDLANLLAQLGGDAEAPVEQQAAYREAQAARDQAALDLRRTTVLAPAEGVVSNIELRPGDYVEAGRAVFALAENATVWVEANMKETDLTHVAVGQSATAVIDAYPGVTFTGRVLSLSPATGAQFSVLPPQNATGNWVKVVQRVPVRIELSVPADAPMLRAGMSATVEVDTGHHRWLPGALRAVLDWMGIVT